jgi:regulatory protein
MFQRSTLSREQALQKARHYCGYQFRCHQEVKEKLYSFGLRRQDVEEALATLVEEDYLNEERFATQFAGGHFRLKQWGRVKIRYELKQRQVSDHCIKKALAAIEEDDYGRTLGKLAAEKWVALKGETDFARRGKLQEYLVRKGFEQDRVMAAIRELTQTATDHGDQ